MSIVVVLLLLSTLYNTSPLHDVLLKVTMYKLTKEYLYYHSTFQSLCFYSTYE